MRQVRDSDYVAAVRHGDRKMPMAMYERLRAAFNAWKRLCRDVAEEDATDVFQDSFVILWENIEHGALYSEDDLVYACRAGRRYDVQDLSACFMGIVKNKYRESFGEMGDCLSLQLMKIMCRILLLMMCRLLGILWSAIP